MNHRWDYVGTFVSGFDHSGMPDHTSMKQQWKCRQCGWTMERSPEHGAPNPEQKFFIEFENYQTDLMDCDQLIAFDVTEL